MENFILVIKKWIDGKNYYKLLGVALVAILIIPTLIHVLAYGWSVMGIGIGTIDGWLSFWGSFFGGIISGILTLVGVMVAFKLQKSATTKAKIIEYYADTFEMLMYLEKLMLWLDEKDIDAAAAEKKRIECEDICIRIKGIDSEVYIRLKYICMELWNIREDLRHLGTTERTTELKEEAKDLFLEIKKYITKV